jgi:hypothetical protein
MPDIDQVGFQAMLKQKIQQAGNIWNPLTEREEPWMKISSISSPKSRYALSVVVFGVIVLACSMTAKFNIYMFTLLIVAFSWLWYEYKHHSTK